jgi:hypothetical protein
LSDAQHFEKNSAQSPRKPDFLIIGAPRSGTTYIAKNLENHPSIAIAASKDDPFANDLHFFDVNTPKGMENYSRGIDWYFQQFQHFPKNVLVGEKTADYLVDIDSPKLIKRHLPAVKLIAILRDPVERAQSHFWHSRHRLPAGLSLSDLVQREQDTNNVWVLESGFYSKQLNRYFQYFDKKQILILFHEDIQNSPNKTLQAICEFLGVEADNIEFKDAFSRINSGSSSIASQFIARVGAVLRNASPRLYSAMLNGPLSKVTKLILQTLRGKKVRSTSHQTPDNTYPKLDTATRRKLFELYKSDIEQLSEMVDRDLMSLWNKPGS